MFRRSLTLCCLSTLATTVAPQSDTPEIETCPDEYSLVDNEYCYYLSPNQAPWDEANAECEERNGWLVAITSANKNFGIREWLEDSGLTFASFYSGPYIGIRRFNTSTTDFTYVTVFRNCNDIRYILRYIVRSYIYNMYMLS